MDFDSHQILFVTNLPYALPGEFLYKVFGQYGAIRQVRIGDTPQTKGSAFIVFEEAQDARVAQAKLNGYDLKYENTSRYLVVSFHNTQRAGR